MSREPHDARGRWCRSNGSARTGAFGATVTLRGRDGFGGSSSRALFGSTVRGVGTQDVALHLCGAGVGDVRLVAFALRATRGDREPGGVRFAECSEIATIEAGDGLTAMPLLLLRSAARTAGVERETSKHALVVHERPFSQCEGRIVWVCGGGASCASVLERGELSSSP